MVLIYIYLDVAVYWPPVCIVCVCLCLLYQIRVLAKKNNIPSMSDPSKLDAFCIKHTSGRGVEIGWLRGVWTKFEKGGLGNIEESS